MASDSAHPAHLPTRRAEESLIPAALFALALTLARIIYLRFICPYDLVEDEAHYWLWSQHLDWSYYSKGPGVAWAIALSTRVLGHAEWAVRLPAAILLGVGTFAAAGLARDLAARARVCADATGSGSPALAAPRIVALLAAGFFAGAPALQATGIIMTIDGPYIACWAVSAWAFWRAVEARSRRAWVMLGAAAGLGFLFKYTMLLLPPGLALYAWLRRRDLQLAPAWRGWAIAALALALLGLVPVCIWNAANDWPTFRHLLGHLGLRGGDMPTPPAIGYGEAPRRWDPAWSLTLIGQQILIIGPALVLALLGALTVLRRAGRADPRRMGILYLFMCAAPVVAFYLIVSFITEPEGNWPLAAYATLMPLAGWIAADALAANRRAHAHGERRARGTGWARALSAGSLAYALIGCGVVHFGISTIAIINFVGDTPWFQRAFHKVMGRERREMPDGRLTGAAEMAAAVVPLLRSIDGGSGPPFVLGQHYGRASQMAYYLNRAPAPGAEKVLVVCAMAYTGGRKSQFDLWEHTRLDAKALIGRSAVILSNNRPETMAVWEHLFERVEPIPGDSQRLPGEDKPDRVAFIGRGYRGPGGAQGASTPAGERKKGGR